MNKFLFMLLMATVVLTAPACKKTVGCTDSSATNFDPEAKEDNNGCIYGFDASAQMNSVQDAGKGLTGILAEDMQLFVYGAYQMGNNPFLRDANPLPSCVDITIDSAAGVGMYPATLTLDFGSNNCVCDDGKLRRGRIHYYISNSWWSTTGNDTVRIYPDNYYVENQLITGTRVYIKQNGFAVGEDAVLPMHVFVESATRQAGNNTYSYDYQGSMQWFMDTLTTYSDDGFSLNINRGTYRAPDTTLYDIKTTSDLTGTFGCMGTCLFTQGTVWLQYTYAETISLGSASNELIGVYNTAHIDFGTSGTCDSLLHVYKTATGTRIENQMLLYNEADTTELDCAGYILVE